jgi:hypothetical protein
MRGIKEINYFFVFTLLNGSNVDYNILGFLNLSTPVVIWLPKSEVNK